MRESPRRLRRVGAPHSRPRRSTAAAALDLNKPKPDQGRRLVRRVRVIRRFLGVMLWTLLSIPVQAVCIVLPGRPKVVFARLYWAGFGRLLGLRVRVIGEVARSAGGRPVVFVSNHSSWVDIPALGGVLDGCFIAKGDVAGWPMIGTIARLGRSVFVSRQRGSTGRERDAMRSRLAAGDNLVLFPEGTSSDGSRVLPFRTSFFAVTAVGNDVAPLIQPVSIVYDRLGGLPTGRASRPVFAWYGDMDIASHFWRLGQNKGLRATVVLHGTLDPARFDDRKALSHAVWRTVADGAATLRQNRPARPLDVQEPMPATSAEPAFA